MAVATMTRGKAAMERKIVSISSKRQITIPLKFFTALGFADEAECIVRGDELILRPARIVSGGEFAEQILADLISQGYQGEELLKQFKIQQTKVRPAVEVMLENAENAAHAQGEYYEYEDVFGEEEE